MTIPGLPVGTDNVIWEGECQQLTPKLRPSGQYAGQWVMPDERIDYQGFALLSHLDSLDPTNSGTVRGESGLVNSSLTTIRHQ